LAVQAGADILLFSQYRLNGENLVEKAVDHLSALVEAGEIDMARINASYRRIQALKTSS
jgi:beta-glucosidase-like glycosyl hydrolase